MPAAQAHRSAGVGAAASEDGGEEEGQGRGNRARNAAPKEYIPRLGSAPFAFLIVMLQVEAGEAHCFHAEEGSALAEIGRRGPEQQQSRVAS